MRESNGSGFLAVHWDTRLPPEQTAGKAGAPAAWRFRHLPTEFVDPSHQQQSTLRRQAGILLDVHPGDPPIIAASVATHSLAGLLRMNNLHSNDS